MADELLLERLLPRAARAAFGRRLLAWHLEELGGLLDRVRYAHEEGQPEEARRALWGRVAGILEALAWNAEETRRLTRARLAEAPPRAPEDLAAAALVLEALDPDAADTRRLLASLPVDAAAVLALRPR